MDLPQNINLPFFAYGIFKPGELAFYRIKEFVKNHSQITVDGNLKIRDGLPLFDKDGMWHVKGYLLYFNENSYEESYRRIIEIEPDKHYRWDNISICEEKNEEANILIGRSPNRGSEQSDESSFNGRNDPLFKEAFQLIDQTIDESGEYCNNDYKEFFKLQMAYLLLWSIIEKYVSFRYRLGEDIRKKVLKLSTDDYFCLLLKENIIEKREVFRSDKPNDDKIVLDKENPSKCLDYYYQIRSNITHRGKASHKDYKKVRLSILELCKIMKATIENAFNESAL